MIAYPCAVLICAKYLPAIDESKKSKKINTRLNNTEIVNRSKHRSTRYRGVSLGSPKALFFQVQSQKFNSKYEQFDLRIFRCLHTSSLR